LYVRALGIGGYGTVDLLQTFANMAYTAAIIGMPMVLASVYVQRAAESERADVIASALVVVMAWAVFVALGLESCCPLAGTIDAAPRYGVADANPITSDAVWGGTWHIGGDVALCVKRYA
jgi:hypothetical protein